MKKAKILLMMFVLFAVVFTSCKDSGNNPGNETKEITLAVTGNNGAVVTVYETDVTTDITIAATESVDRDVEVDLMTNVTDGSATLSATKVTLAKGTNAATVTITFPASKFPQGTAEKAIKVTASTTADLVTFSPAFTTFNVKGQGGQEAPAILTAVAEVLEINTTDAEGVAVINFTLSKAVDTAIEITCAYEFPSDFVGTEGVTWNPYPVKIAKNTTTLRETITVPQGRVGSMPIVMSCASDKVTVETEKITFNFVTIVNPNPEAAISTANTTVNVEGEDVTRIIDITLNKAVEEEVTVHLGVASDSDVSGLLSASTVIFAPNETSKSVDITFAAVDFGQDVQASITVTATSENVDIKPSAASVIFTVKGPVTKQDLQVNWYPNKTEVYYASGESANKRIDVYITTKNNVKPTSDITFTPHITGLDSEDYMFDQGKEIAVITPTAYYTWFYIYVKPSAVGKDMNLTFTSSESTFVDTQKPYVVSIRPLSPPAQKYNSNIGLSIDGQKTASSVGAKDFLLTVSTADGEAPTGASIVNFVVTGFAAADYMFFDNPFVLSEATQTLWFRVHASAKGKTGTVTPISDYVTVASDAAVTVTIN